MEKGSHHQSQGMEVGKGRKLRQMMLASSWEEDDL